MYNLSDTIAAICTPKGIGSIAAIRLSGKDSWEIVNKIFSSRSLCERGSPAKGEAATLNAERSMLFTPMQAQYGHLYDKEKLIDEVIVLPYKSPNSFTTEDSIEIFCHGGIQIPSMVLDLCLKNGARLAQKGEFTFRAFVNGRIDLTEAEAINDLIHADSEKLALSSIESIKGSLKEKIASFKQLLVNLLSTIESAIEFPSDVPPINPEYLKATLTNLHSKIQSLITSSKEGQILRQGIKVCIVGPPNAGKSSLLNRLLENERAIVTDIPGTTRDLIEEKVTINGYPIVIIDTAGIRNDNDLEKPEFIGIKKSKEILQKSELAIIVFDINNFQNESLIDITNNLNGQPKIIIGNKIDLIKNEIVNNHFDILISATEGTNIQELKTLLTQRIESILPKNISTDVFINERQKTLLIQCNNSIENAIEMIKKNIPEDIFSDELKKGIAKLDQISGTQVNEEIMSNIFEKFCIGK